MPRRFAVYFNASLLAGFVAFICLTACSPTHAQSTPRHSGLEPVRIQLKWSHQFQFAGFYAAVAKGFYRDVGLDVSLVEGGPAIDPVAVVLSGAAAFGVGNSSLIVDRAQGRPLVALAAIFQHSPFVVLARRGDGINGPADLRGRKVMIEEHSAEVLAYLHALGLWPNKLQILPYEGDPLVLAQGEIAAINAYSTTEPFILLRNDVPYQTFNPRELGIDFYGDTLFTTSGVAAERPELARAVRDASLRGWQYALNHQQEIIDLILRDYMPGFDRRRLEFEADAMRPLIIADVVDLGYQSEARWRRIADQFAAAGMMPEHFPLSGFIFEAPRRSLRWLYLSLAAATLLVMVAAFLAQRFYRLNRQLRREMELSRRLQSRLSKLAATDDLTQVLNRRRFLELAGDAFARARAAGTALSVAVMDLDDFKAVNDSHGHAAGDEVLQAVARAVSDMIGTTAVFARTGGEEFALLFAGFSQEATLASCERIRARIAELRVRAPCGDVISLTISVGVAGMGADDETFDAMLARADSALYMAKKDGRDLVRAHPLPVSC
ncbi:ABC transporter substrate-binding protein [Roseixanthobacter glucoisosaccharinicivorans]|uniref:ABC transporter substrate-binding protein n=1 Tax=Roseixanthobacter glucoisosaccharinicivorans TaxID=3119923 RepID=UPI0037265C55